MALRQMRIHFGNRDFSEPRISQNSKAGSGLAQTEFIGGGLYAEKPVWGKVRRLYCRKSSFQSSFYSSSLIAIRSTARLKKSQGVARQSPQQLGLSTRDLGPGGKSQSRPSPGADFFWLCNLPGYGFRLPFFPILTLALCECGNLTNDAFNTT
jgi:hypothetical protein